MFYQNNHALCISLKRVCADPGPPPPSCFPLPCQRVPLPPPPPRTANCAQKPRRKQAACWRPRPRRPWPRSSDWRCARASAPSRCCHSGAGTRSTSMACARAAQHNHAKNKIAGRIISFSVLGFWDKTPWHTGTMPYCRDFPATTRIYAFHA